MVNTQNQKKGGRSKREAELYKTHSDGRQKADERGRGIDEEESKGVSAGWSEGTRHVQDTELKRARITHFYTHESLKMFPLPVLVQYLQ